MVVVALDTHALVKDLQAAGFSEVQAEALTRAVGRGQDLDLSHLATRAELTATRTELKSDIENLRKDVKADIAELKADILKWVVGLVGFQFVAIVGAMVTIARILRP